MLREQHCRIFPCPYFKYRMQRLQHRKYRKFRNHDASYRTEFIVFLATLYQRTIYFRPIIQHPVEKTRMRLCLHLDIINCPCLVRNQHIQPDLFIDGELLDIERVLHRCFDNRWLSDVGHHAVQERTQDWLVLGSRPKGRCEQVGRWLDEGIFVHTKIIAGITAERKCFVPVIKVPVIKLLGDRILYGIARLKFSLRVVMFVHKRIFCI